MKAPKPINEEERIAVLHSMEILDTDPEDIFQGMVELAAQICDVPVALISFVDSDRQWFKARVGLDVCETSRDVSFCAYAILQAETFIVEDTTLDSRFVDNPLVCEEPGVRFYAGAQLVHPTGERFGTICVIDFVPRKLSDRQLRALCVLADQVIALLESRLVAGRLFKAIKDRNYAEREAAIVRQRFDEFMVNCPAACTIRDESGHFFFVNAIAASVLCATPEEIVGTTIHDWLSPESAASYLEVDEQAIATGFSRGVVSVGKHGQIFSAQRFAFKDDFGRLFIGSVSIDITAHENDKKKLQDLLETQRLTQVALETQQRELERANELLKELATTDGLTGLNNHRQFQERLAIEVASFMRDPKVFSVAILDVDRFKEYNDAYGHPAGDELLKRLAVVLERLVRQSDFVSRYGGEEFAMVLPDANEETARGVCDRIRQAIEDEGFEHEGVTASLGFATATPGFCDPKNLIEAADRALYESKRSGRNRVTGFNDLQTPSQAA